MTAKGKVKALITIKGNKEHLGCFDDPEAASLAYRKRHAELCGELSPYYSEFHP